MITAYRFNSDEKDLSAELKPSDWKTQTCHCFRRVCLPTTLDNDAVFVPKTKWLHRCLISETTPRLRRRCSMWSAKLFNVFVGSDALVLSTINLQTVAEWHSQTPANSKAVDVAVKQTPGNTYPPMRSIVVPHLTLTLTLTSSDTNYHQNLTVSSLWLTCRLYSEFCENRLSSFCVILLTNYMPMKT